MEIELLIIMDGSSSKAVSCGKLEKLHFEQLFFSTCPLYYANIPTELIIIYSRVRDNV